MLINSNSTSGTSILRKRTLEEVEEEMDLMEKEISNKYSDEEIIEENQIDDTR